MTLATAVCSLLDVVAEVTTKIQGADDTHISQTMFNMKEIMEIFADDEHRIRVQDQNYSDGDVLKEKMGVDELTSETLLTRDTMIAKLTKKNLGYALMPLERICALLDPRRKECSTEHLSLQRHLAT